MTEKPDMAHGIYRVTHTLSMGTASHVCESDLIFLEGKPIVVLEWGDKPGSPEQYPMVTLPLDPAFLEETKPDGYFIYSGQLADPRSVQ